MCIGALSIVVALGASIVALWLAFHLRKETTVSGSLRKMGSAIVMGNAIAGMHYTAMAAVSFKHNQSSTQLFPVIDNSLLGIGIAIATLVVLTLALMTAVFDQRLSAATARAEALRESEERFRSLMLNTSDINEPSVAGIVTT